MNFLKLMNALDQVAPRKPEREVAKAFVEGWADDRPDLIPDIARLLRWWKEQP